MYEFFVDYTFYANGEEGERKKGKEHKVEEP